MEFFREFGRYLLSHKKFWLLPIFIVLGLLGGLIFFTQGTAVAPFVYTLF